MSKIIDRLSRKMSTNTSRRGFITTLGKVAAGIAALFIGNGVTNTAQASTGTPLLCCDGNACPSGLSACPHNTIQNYVWYCCTNGNLHTTCHDC